MEKVALSLEWKKVGVVDDESGGDGAGEWSEKNRKKNGQDAADGSYSKDRVMHVGKSDL